MVDLKVFIVIHSYFDLVLHLSSAKINPNHSNYTVRIEMYTIADKNTHDTDPGSEKTLVT